MGIKFIFNEPADIGHAKTMFKVKYDELGEKQKEYYSHLLTFGHCPIIPECIKRVWSVGVDDDDTSFDHLDKIWKETITISTLEERKITKRLDLKFRDDDGIEKITHIDPFLLVYCNAPWIVKKEDYKKVNPFRGG